MQVLVDSMKYTLATKTGKPRKVPKSHKPGVLIRPVVDYRPYGTYILAKCLNGLPKPC